MDAFLNTINNLWQIVVTQINIFLQPIPDELWYFGLIAGFFLSIPEKQPYHFRETNKTLFEIRRASSLLSVITVLAVAAYIFYVGGPWQLLYLFGALLLGIVCYQLVYRLLRHVNLLGSLCRNICTILSGPVIIFLAWFLYTGEFMNVIREIVHKLPF